MTSTLPARRRRDPGVRARGFVYGYLTLAHADRTVIEFGYGGQSVRPPAARDREHRDDKPWQDLIVGSPQVIADGWWTQDELDAVERAVIRGQWGRVESLVVAEAARRGAVPVLAGLRACRDAGPRPRYNVAFNERNRMRVDPTVALAQRWARDDEAGFPRWLPPAERVDVVIAPAHLRVPWLRRVVRRVGVPVLAAWLLLAAAFWSVLVGPWDAVAGGSADLAGLVGWSPVPSAGLAAWLVWWAFREGGRQGRRRRRR